MGPTAFNAHEFGDWLRRSREMRGLTKGELSERAPINRGTLQQFEKGEHGGIPSVEIFQRLARGLELDLGYVLHQAGYDVGREGVNMARLKRVEAVLDALDDDAPKIRLALAEAIKALDAAERGIAHIATDSLLAQLGRALGALDVVTERLREDRPTHERKASA